MFRYFRPALIAGAALFASACENASTGPGDDRQNRAGRSETSTGQDAYTEEREFVELAREIPGFGGYHYDDGGNLVVTMAAESQLALAARSRFEDKLARFQERLARVHRPLRGGGKLVVRRGQFTFPQLAGWRDEVVAAVLGLPGVIFVDLDEAANRVTVGIDRTRFAAARGEAASTLARGHVPPAALTFVETSPIVPEQTSSGTTVDDRRRPLMGGLAMDYSLNGVYVSGCTIGFVAEQNGRRGFITNSHCSYKEWGTENTEYHQSTFDGGSSVGFEYRDSNGSSCGLFSSRNCRKSDATFAAVHVDAELGTIARTTYVGGPGRHAVGSKEIDAGTQQVIVSKPTSTAQGELVDKVGRTTGWTTGSVERSCVEVSVSSSKVLRCQHYASYGSASGDSGSPVFTTEWRFVYINPYRVSLRGVHSGATQDGLYAVFSPITGIEADLGTLTVF